MSFAGVSFVGYRSSSTPSTSRSITVADSGYYLLVVDGYSSTKDIIPTGECIKSHSFRLGGHCWHIEYYPNGRVSGCADSVSLDLLIDDSVTETVEVQFGFSFVDDADQKQVPPDISATKVCNFSNEIYFGHSRFIKREDLERSTYLKDDRFIVRCDIIVQDVNIDTTPAAFVLVPDSDLHQQFASLLQSGEGADVTFEVGGEIFAAHRSVLASRSTVIKEELLGGPMEEGTAESAIRIDDMEARVFKLLLGFIYSDSVPEMEEEEDDVTWQHLFAVADRYDLQRLRLICEEKLCAFINTSSAATVLALAEQHHCQGLKEACLDFLRVHANLQEVMLLGGLDSLASSCPSVLKELIAKLVSPKTDVGTGGTSPATLPFVVVPASDMHQHFIGLLQSGEGTDVKFEVSGETISAHRCVLAARSAVFRAELFGPMKEGATTSVIRIDDMEEKVFKLLLSFIYSDMMPDIEEADDCEEHDDNDDDAYVIWQQLLVAADRYDIQRLRLMCEEELCWYICTTTVATLLELAEQYNCRGLKEACLNFLDFPSNLQKVMAAGGLNHLKTTCPSLLIDLIAKLASLKLDN